ncbi:large ribosomal subunit protein eL28-like [Anolis carolinensis]|uniref:Large ribosomal subunit protein eL28 n=1 Tax=Anolis carolinensis TaxID=28377 RepID=G1KEZ7_ANOCA
MLAHRQWMTVHNCSSFLIKRNKQMCSMKLNNLKACTSLCYNGLIHHKTVRVELATDDKGIIVVLKKLAGQQKPATSYEKITINKNSHATLISLQLITCKNNYCKDLHIAALRLTSTILCSQKPVVVKKKRTRAIKAA